MKRKDLKSLELSDEVIDKIMELHGVSVEENKSALNTVKNEAQQYKTQLQDATVKIESFKGMKSPEEVEAAIGEWKTKAETAQEVFNAKIQKMNFDSKLDEALKTSGVKNLKAVKIMLNEVDLKLNEDGTAIVGLEEQLKPIKESNDYAPFFETTGDPPPKVTTSTRTKTPDGQTTFAGAIEDRLKSQSK